MSRSPESKTLRRRAILDIVAKGNVATQQDIVAALAKRGVEATQVSVSRDVAELGLVKIGGFYHAGNGSSSIDPELPFRVWVRNVSPAGPNLIVILCQVGTAQGVARALDQAALPGIVGTVAGDDTIFVAVSSAKANAEMQRFFKSRLRQP